MLDREPLPRTPETRHHLVRDHQNAVPIAELADALDVAVRWNQDAVGADDGLEEDGRDGVRSLVTDHVLETLKAFCHGSRFVLTPAMRIGIPDNADESGFRRPAAWIAGQRHCAHRGPVIGAVPGEDLVSAGVLTRDLDRVLDGLRPAECEEDLVEVSGQERRQLLTEARANLGDECRLHELQLGGLLGDRLHDPLVAVSDVHRHELAVEVEDAPAFRRVQPDSFRVIDGDGIDCTLHRPREERVLLRQPRDLFAGHAALCDLNGHGVLSSDGCELGTARRYDERR